MPGLANASYRVLTDVPNDMDISMFVLVVAVSLRHHSARIVGQHALLFLP
jgi:hypothetical protein